MSEQHIPETWSRPLGAVLFGRGETPCDRCADRGMCCRYIELPLARALSDDEQRWVELHPDVRMVGPSTVRIETKCSALTDEGHCSLYGTPDRPEMCERWPDDVEAQAPVGCAYRVA